MPIPKLGATGKFPKGKLDDTDEGALTMAIAADHGNQVVRIDFGKQVIWFALPKQQALEFAALIHRRAQELD